jgi:hypoxanthine phosphoribosyltransferase
MVYDGMSPAGQGIIQETMDTATENCIDREHGISHAVPLEAGMLRLHILEQRWPLPELLGYASRNNPRRGFLLVSRVLGRHIPVAPQRIAEAAAALAAQLETSLPGPVVFLALAETATLLGALVHHAYGTLTSREDLVFLQTSRYRLGELACCAQESHSHAPNHFVHWPMDPALRAMLRAARTLVLVDDELTTGSTMSNLVRACQAILEHELEVRRVVLTDFSPSAPGSVVSLLRGRLAFEPDPAFETEPIPKDIARRREAIRLVDPGRLGYDRLPAWPLPSTDNLAGQCILVLGVGEFTAQPWRWAMRAAACGATVAFQAITRSPVCLGGAIQSRLILDDPYGEGVPHFLYNVRPGQYDAVVVCHEPGARPVLPGLDGLCHVELAP